eukprot:TRINITY_DN34417_c0_g1_i11.p3 TRINITY_DN34417_c0_g1~~TRINITY_DN34417_c0_g1_i11.p3  ORF type:complete len:121 (+),score=4.44 TRINITY_DN34417_c0_g1_i11:268-630(+)
MFTLLQVWGMCVQGGWQMLEKTRRFEGVDLSEVVEWYMLGSRLQTTASSYTRFVASMFAFLAGEMQPRQMFFFAYIFGPVSETLLIVLRWILPTRSSMQPTASYQKTIRKNFFKYWVGRE